MELLIVTVVIAILAAISIVAYAGIQERARDTAHRQEVAQAERALTTQIMLDGGDPGGIAGKLIGFGSSKGSTVHLLRPISGTPGLTMYIACAGSRSIDLAFLAPAALKPSGSTNNFRFQSGASGDESMGVRIDTSTATNRTRYREGVRSVNQDYIGWIQASNEGALIRFNYNEASPLDSVVSLDVHSGWEFNQLVTGESGCSAATSLLFEAVHDETTRASVLKWLGDQYGIELT